jgi:hypothetical protein
VSKNHLGIDVDHHRDHPIDFARNAGKQGRERHALPGLVIDRLAQARYRLNFVNNFGE